MTIVAVAISMTAMAQGELTIENWLTGRLVSNRGSSPMEWYGDGDTYYAVQLGMSGREVVGYNLATGDCSVLIEGAAFRVKDEESGYEHEIPITDIEWGADRKCALIYNNAQKVWRYYTRGDYWYVDIEHNRCFQLGTNLPEASLMHAKLSPDCKKVAYVSCNDIYVEDLESRKQIRLTLDGSDEIVNGVFDWAYEEEFDCLDGFRWSPDSKYIAFWHSDTKGTGNFAIIDNIDSIYPSISYFPYQKAGTPPSAVKIGYVSANGGKISWVDIPGEPNNNYLPRMEFIPESDEIMIQQLNRQQNTNHIWVATLNGAAPKNIFTDSDDAWLDPNDDIVWLDNNKWFTWLSERDGWRHLYRISRDGKEIVPITKGDFDVVSVEGYDMELGLVYFIASPFNYTQRYLYSAELFGDGCVTRVSPENQEGTHTYNISPNGKWAQHSFSNASNPGYYDIISLPDHKTKSVLVTNSRAKDDYERLKLNTKEFVKVKSGDLMLDAWILKPRDFDPTKRYPVIDYVYGEPADATVKDDWEWGYMWDQIVANNGFIVVSIENRGAAAPRGREWRKCIYGEVGTFAAEDQANGILELCRQFPYMDSTRIGINGWSGGGSQTLNCMFRYPEIFKVGIAIAGVANQLTYDNIYQERYMGTPQENPEGYKKGSPISYASGLQGELLLIHGTADDNVHYQNTEMLVNELVKYGKMFYEISYPMRTHSISERSNTTLHLRKSMLKFWLDKL